MKLKRSSFHVQLALRWDCHWLWKLLLARSCVGGGVCMLMTGVIWRGFQRPWKLQLTDHMAPTFYHYLPVPMDVKLEKQGRNTRRWLLVGVILAVLFVVVLVTMLIYFAVRANSEACRDGLRAQEECRNTTELLQRELTRSQDSLLQAETHANTCNRTVVRLKTVPSNAPRLEGGFETAKQVPTSAPSPQTSD